MVNGISKVFYLGLLTICLTACGGGSSGDEGYSGAGLIKVTITADKTTLAVNSSGQPPGSGPFTNTFTVRVERPDGTLFPASSITVDLTPNVAGGLYYLDGDKAHEKCETPAGSTVEVCTPLAYRRLAFEKTSGIVTGHFLAGSAPSTVTLTATAIDPNTNQSVSATLQVTVGQGVSTGQAAEIRFHFNEDTPGPGPLYITGQGQNDVKTFEVIVLDDADQPVPNPTGNNLRLQLLAGRPNGGEKLVTVDAARNTQEGTVVNTATVNGVAQVALHAGSLPGTVRIAAMADRADNNVDNDIQASVTDVSTIPISTGEITSITFTGPFPGAVFAHANTLFAAIDDRLIGHPPYGINPQDVLLPDGDYVRFIKVITADEFGNPPPEGTNITFRLVDGPLDLDNKPYPKEGHGQFVITGNNGDPEEGGNTFFAPNRTVSRGADDFLNPFVVPNGGSLAIANPNCLLVLEDPLVSERQSEGRFEFHIGSRIITGRADNTLSVNTPFNQTLDLGRGVPYTVGCPPHKGNVTNFQSVNGGNIVTVQTDINGIALTTLNYPITQIGRRFKLVAESDGGKAGAVLSHWYLGIPDGSSLRIIAPAGGNTFIVPVGQVPDGQPDPSEVVTLQLLDGGVDLCAGKCEDSIYDVFSPIPGEAIPVEVVVTDKDEIAAAAAEAKLARANAALDALQKELGGSASEVASSLGNNCPRPNALCTCNNISSYNDSDAAGKANAQAICQAEKDVNQANLDAVKARAIADQSDFTACATADETVTTVAQCLANPRTAFTDANGEVKIKLQVHDMPPNGTVEFFFTTVGPEIRTKTVKVTAQPAPSSTTTTASQ
jgi:hypothetical protein